MTKLVVFVAMSLSIGIIASRSNTLAVSGPHRSSAIAAHHSVEVTDNLAGWTGSQRRRSAELQLPAQSRPDAIITDSQECPECRIRFVEIARIRSAYLPASITVTTRLTRATSGGWYVGPLKSTASVFRVSSTGVVLDTIGRRGSGPGELRSHSFTFTSDSRGRVLIADNSLQRLSVFDSAGAFQSSLPLQRQVQSIDVFGSRLLVQAHFYTPTLLGYTLHLYEIPTGKRLSFGYDGQLHDRRLHWRDERVLAKDDTSIWSIRPNRYEIEVYSREGKLLQSWVRLSSWFKTWEMWPAKAPMTEKPVPTVMAAHKHADTLWVVTTIPDRNWQAISPKLAPEATPETIDQFFDVRMEAIDTRKRQLIVSARYRTWVRFTPTGEAYAIMPSKDGDSEFVIWRPAVTLSLGEGR